MKKVYTLLTIILLGLAAASAQDSKQRTWQMGPLTWDDFTPAGAISGNSPKEHSFLEYVFDIKTVAKDYNGIKTGQPEAVAYTIKSKSWVDTTQWRTPEQLRYNQVLFDMVELYRRKLQQMINENPGCNEELLLDSVMFMALERTDQFCNETQYGNDTVALEAWQDSIQTYLHRTQTAAQNDSAAVRASYTYVDDPIRLGGSFGLSFLGTGGGLHDYFSHGFGLGMSFEVCYNRHSFMMGFNVGGCTCFDSVPNANNTLNYFLEGDVLSILNGYVGYGFSVVDGQRIRITPFAGWGGLGYFYSEEGEDEESSISYGMGNGCFHFGVDMQYHFQNTIFAMEHERYSVDLKLYGTYNRFRSIVGVPEGFTFNIQIGISILTGSVTRKD